MLQVDISDGYYTVVLNTNPYTYLGNRPLDLSPHATLDRGLVALRYRYVDLTLNGRLDLAEVAKSEDHRA